MDKRLKYGAPLTAAIILAIIALVNILAPSRAGYAATPVGTVIHNSVQVVDESAPGQPMTYTSVADLIVVHAPTPSTVELLRYAPWFPGAEQVNLTLQSNFSTTGALSGPFNSIGAPSPIANAGPLSLNAQYPMIPATSFRENDVVFIRLTDRDQNNNPGAIESVVVTVTIQGTTESEVIRLYETGPDTGVFTGYVPMGYGAAQPNNGVLNHDNPQERIIVNYVDATDPTDRSTAVSLLDPFGVVFDSATGARISGTQVTIMDAATGLPATVFGDDGVSAYPSSVISGTLATDGSGKVYNFGPGEYRFPMVNPGTYYFVVTPAPAYKFPSNAPLAGLQSLPGAPYVILDPGSLGGNYSVTALGGNVQIDIPMDPIRAYIYLNKTSSKASAAIGDFVQYRITAQNMSKEYVVTGGSIIDRMPLGMRFKSGSARVNGASAPDPVISDDGRTLTFDTGSLAIGALPTEVSYVVSVSVGAKTGPATNSATASGTLPNFGRVISNTATAIVEITDDLFADKTFIMGRVFGYGCWNGDGDGNPDPGVAGVRIYMEDGSYAITDKKGMYHFAGLKRGTHVVQLDLATIPEGYELKECEENTRFAGKPYSQFVDLQGRSMWRADFYLARTGQPDIVPPSRIEYRGEINMELKSRIVYTDELVEGARPVSAGTVRYETVIQTGSAPVKNAKVMIMLADGVTYKAASARLNDAPFADPRIAQGALIFSLGDVGSYSNLNIAFEADVAAKRKEEDLPAKAILTFDTNTARNLKVPVAENLLKRVLRVNDNVSDEYTLYPKFAVMSASMSNEDNAMMDILIPELRKLPIKMIEVVGHTDSTPISQKNRSVYADNYELSKARAQSIADFIKNALDLRDYQVVVSAEGPDKPVASNKTGKGRAQNRRVELKLVLKEYDDYVLRNFVDRSGVKYASIDDVYVRGPLVLDGDGTKSVASLGAVSVSSDENYRVDEPVKAQMPVFDAEWLDRAEPGFAWIWPLDGYYPEISSLNVAVKHDPKRKITLLLNDAPVEPLRFEGITKSNDGLKRLSFWRGVDLKEGDNRFVAIEEADGIETGRIEKTFHYSSIPVKIEVVASRTRLVADGRRAPVVALRLLDRDGHPARRNSLVEYTVDAPYEPLKKSEALEADPLSAPRSLSETFKIGDDGMVYLRLKPTTRSGDALLRIKLAHGTETIKLWVEPDDRDWVVVGLGEGTVGYNAVSGNMTSLTDSEADDKLYENGRLALFAKGKVLGKWLMTIGYDSDKKWMNGPRGLYQSISPDKYYTVYGDATETGYEAQSSRPLYLKIEKDHFYALFGDFETGLGVTELSRYNRSLNGIKSEYRSDDFDLNVFASANNQAFVRDEIRGDGTSGLYRLSKRNVVMNSEIITIETRDRFRSELILSSQTLTRYLDYSIDYETGEIFFKNPIGPTDAAFNPVYIVANYESFDASVVSTTAGGRGAVRLFDKSLELGATFVNENSGTKTGDMKGVDVSVNITDRTIVKAETSFTNSSMSGSGKDGNGFLAEISHRMENGQARLYVREQTGDFGLGQERSAEAGTLKYGFDGTYSPLPSWSVNGSAYRQYRLDSVEFRDMVEARARYLKDNYELYGGLRHAEEVDLNANTTGSEQLIAGGKYKLFDNRLTLHAEHDQSIVRGDSYLYPTKTVVGADIAVTETSSVFVQEELSRWTDGYTSRASIGLKSAPWSGAQVTSSVGEQIDESGARLFASNGLKQTWKITDAWKMDAGFDNSSSIDRKGAKPDTSLPDAYSTDFTSGSVGLAYRMNSRWSWTGRVEARHSASEDKQGVYSGFIGEPFEGVGISAALMRFLSDSSDGMRRLNTDIRIGFAYRPRKTSLIILNRFDYLVEESRNADFGFSNWRIVDNMNLNFKLTGRFEAALQYGAKYVKETIDAQDYSGYTDLSGVEVRYDIYKDMDVGVKALALHSWSDGQFKYGGGPSIGYNIKENFWISVGYNIVGFKDRDFSKADFTAAGPYIKLRIKFDQESAAEAIKRFSGR